MSKAYEYGGPGVGSYDTRHEAVGKAAVIGREDGDIRQAPFDGPKDALRLVAPIPTLFCGYCRQTFEREPELDEHKPCPEYEQTEGRRGSNPIEAARMTEYGL